MIFAFDVFICLDENHATIDFKLCGFHKINEFWLKIIFFSRRAIIKKIAMDHFALLQIFLFLLSICCNFMLHWTNSNIEIIHKSYPKNLWLWIMQRMKKLYFLKNLKFWKKIEILKCKLISEKLTSNKHCKM